MVEIINTKSQGHLLAISTRAHIEHIVTDALIGRGNRQVIRNVAQNLGAKFSDAGLGFLVKRSQQDDLLAEAVGLRRDLPHDLFAKLFSEASDAVQRKLAAANPTHAGDISRVLSRIAADAIGTIEQPPRDLRSGQSCR